MNLDELGKEWRATNEVAATKEQREQLIAATRRRVERLWGGIFSRDVLETSVAVVLIIFFGWWCWLPNDLVLSKQGSSVVPASVVISKIGAGVVVCWALFIIYKLHRTRTIQKPASLDAPVREFCRIELDRLERQIRLLRSVLWWYIAPEMVGLNIFYVGVGGFRIKSLFFCISTLLLAWGVCALNMRAVAKGLAPLRNELASLLSELDDAVALED